ncbi:FAD binding domain-containing protein [Rutstroemia sp. NJR-2017a BVV2]|nr:FAD binding domain-containing protein [Rutstroemia sp. NJR-2017a BVV2]
MAYIVNATTAQDVRKAVIFANRFDLRLVIRSTGHDYNGKSTGAGALAIWTHHMTSTSLIDYSSPSYTGKAAVLGAGVTSYQAYQFADANNGSIVAGNCHTVAVAGGYSQGGGHSPHSTKFGLAVDQILEWHVITGVGGDIVKATPTHHTDLYWALSGGGGGTYGVVLSVTVKFHPPITRISSASLQFAQPTTADGIKSYWESVRVFLKSLPLMIDSGMQLVWTVAPGYVLVAPVVGLDVEQEALDELFSPILSALKTADIPYNYTSSFYTTFLPLYDSEYYQLNVSDTNLAGRLLPRSVVQNNTDSFISVIRTLVNNNYLIYGITLDVNKTLLPNAPAVSVNPYWRKTLVNAVYRSTINYVDFEANFRNQNFLTNVIGPQLAALTPGGAVYVNEADFQQRDWKEVFYGENYERLEEIKRRWDPEDRFYALGAVGSDRWVQRSDGRLCRI